MAEPTRVRSLALDTLAPDAEVSRAAAVIVALGGGYITYVHPRCLRIGSKWVLRGWVLILVDWVFHQLPLVLLWARWRRSKARSFLTPPGVLAATLLFVLYLQLEYLPRAGRSAPRSAATRCARGISGPLP